MRILFIGDIFGKPGREIVRRAVPALVEIESLDFVIANVENSAAGFGVTGDIADTILGYGVDAMTTGNHVWDKKEVLDYIPRQPKLLRPANFPAGVPGRGSYIGKTRSGEPIGVINVMGRIFMQPLDDPFAVVLKEIEAMRAKARVILVDFHAEATSEKVAMGWHLDGRVTAVFGTHTHVQTADRHRLSHGCGHDRAARLDHRRHDRDRPVPLPDVHAGALRVGDRSRTPQRRDRHRGPGHRQGHRAPAAEPVGRRGRGAGRRRAGRAVTRGRGPDV
jgi:metallophosphoesterase (TIGR00282 family)